MRVPGIVESPAYWIRTYEVTLVWPLEGVK
jgi:hypothetical protein